MNKIIYSKILGKKVLFKGELFNNNLTLDKKNNTNNNNNDHNNVKEIIGSAEINKLFTDENYRYDFITGLHEITKKAPIYLRMIFSTKSLDINADEKITNYIEQFK